MSLIKLQARNYQILVGDQDVSDYCKGDSGGYLSIREDLLDFAGHIGCHGQLVLRSPVGGTLDLDPRTNCTFARGAKVTIKVSPVDSSTLYTYRTLRVLQDPIPPTEPDRTITLELGDLLTLLDFKRPESEEAGFEPGTTRTRTALINALLNSVGAPAMTGAIPEYPLVYPPNRGNESPIRQAAKLAAEAGYCLWVNHLEQIVPVNLRQRQIKLLWDFRVGGPAASDYSYKPASSRIAPFEKLKCTGVALSVDRSGEDEVDECVKTYTSSKTTLGPRGERISELTETLTINRCTGVTIETITELTAGNLIVPDSSSAIFSTSLSQRKITTTDARGNLLTESLVKLEPLARIAPESRYPFSLKISFEEDISYQYDDKGRLIRKRTVQREPIVRIAPELVGGRITEFALLLRTSLSKTESWEYISDDLVHYSATTMVPFIKRLKTWDPYSPPSLDVALSLVSFQSVSKITRDLPSSSFNSDTSPPKVEIKEKFLQAEIVYLPLCNPQFRETEKQINFETAVSEAHIREVGNIWGTIWLGRQWAYEVVSFLPLGLLTQPKPIFGANVTEHFTGYQYQAIAEGHSLVLGQDRCLFGFHFISLGGIRIPPPLPNVPTPSLPPTDGSAETTTPVGTIPGVIVVQPPFTVAITAERLINLVGDCVVGGFLAQPTPAEGYIDLVGLASISSDPDPDAEGYINLVGEVSLE